MRLTSNRWPDCTTLDSAISDIFRLEGVGKKSGQEKALALWKWFRIMTSATGGHYAYEGPKGREKLVWGPHRIFTCYGHHQCDGLSWAMVGLWRAAGYIGFDECTFGHTIAALRYRDRDGRMRFHDLDPQGRFYYWDAKHKWIGTWTVPVMRGRVYRHITAPRRLHSLRTSLRVGETIERRWENRGHIIPSGRDKAKAEKSRYYAYRPGRSDGIYAAVGEEVQTLDVPTDPGSFAGALYTGSRNAACSNAEKGKATLHPEKAGQTACFVYRLAPPYPVVEAECRATLVKSRPEDVCRLAISRDGVKWRTIYEKKDVGLEKMSVYFGKNARRKGRPDVYTAYDVLVRAEFKTAGDVRGVGLNALKLTAFRQLSKRALPNLRPGENYLRLTADRIAEGRVLELRIDYQVKGKPRNVTRHVRKFPHYFKVNVPGVSERILKNYDKDFNNGELRTSAISMRLVPAAGAPAGPASLRAGAVRARFAMASPHPADMTDRKIVKRPETDPAQTSGFFPQSRGVLDDEAAMKALIRKLKGRNARQQWLAAEDLGNYPKSIDALLEALPGANIDLTLFICKALAQIGDRKAVGPLLEKWKQTPAGAPGTRYIPDALAAIGDPGVVPQLIAPLKKCRFDYRFHIAHALGELGGPRAEKALEDLAAGDPFPGVREEAQRALKHLRAKRRKR